MELTRGSGSNDPENLGTSNDGIHRIVTVEVVTTIRETIPEMFGSIEVVMIDLFYERYIVITEATVATMTTILLAAKLHEVIRFCIGSSTTRSILSCMGSRTQFPSKRWVSDAEGCF